MDLILTFRDIMYERFPDYWFDKKNLSGLLLAISDAFSKVDTDAYKVLYQHTLTYGGTSVANENILNDYGALFNISRQGKSNAVYYQQIIDKIAEFSNSGTITDIINSCNAISKSVSDSTFVDVNNYPNTRFSTIRCEGSILTSKHAQSLNRLTSSGCKVYPIWSIDSNTFLPAVEVTSTAPEPLAATLDSGSSDILARLGVSYTDTIGVSFDIEKIFYPDTVNRSTLKPSILSSPFLQTESYENINIGTSENPIYLEVVDAQQNTELYLAITSDHTNIV